MEHGGGDGAAEATSRDAGSHQQLEEAGSEFSPQPLGALPQASPSLASHPAAPAQLLVSA